VKPGFDPENLLRVQIHPPWEKYGKKRDLRNLLLAQLHEQLAALPGVKAVAIEKQNGYLETFKLDGREGSVELHRVGCGVEESDLFRAMGIPLLTGRYFNKDDLGEGSATAIINESTALSAGRERSRWERSSMGRLLRLCLIRCTRLLGSSAISATSVTTRKCCRPSTGLTRN